MFHWCQNVNVFNIENHYHFYNERTINSANRAQVSYDKLKPGPISLTTSSNLGRSSKSCFKKGLNLCKKLNKQQNPQPNNKLQQIQYSSIQQPKLQNTKQHTISITISQADMAKTKSIQSQHSLKQILKPSINPKINTTSQKQQNIIKIYPNTTYIDRDSNNNNNSILLITGNKNNNQIRNYSHAHTHTYSYKQQNNLLLTQLYSTQKSSNNNQTTIINTNTKTSSNIISNINTNTNINPNTNINTNINSNINNKSNNYNNIETIPIRSSNKDQLLDLTTSRNLYSRQRSQRQITTSDKYQDMRIQQQNQIQIYQRDSNSRSRSIIQDSLSRSSRGYNNSKYNISKSMSASVNYSSIKNQGYFLRVMEMSRGEARQASIILSNILSRGSQNCYSSSHHNNYMNIKQQIKTFNFQDKLTILSQQNDVLSQRQSQLKVQQSQLYDMDPCSNFTIIQNKQIISNIYHVNLAIQNYTQCIVSLKQIGFRQMKIISQQLQIYQFIQQKLINTDSSRHILQLYQFQTTSNSYLLIKQPYTQNLISYYFSLSKQTKNIFITQFYNMLQILLHQFANQLMFPYRLFTILDFVICDSVIKLQDLSIFKQMKKSIFMEEQLLKITQLNNNNNIGTNLHVNQQNAQNQQIQVNNI